MTRISAWQKKVGVFIHTVYSSSSLRFFAVTVKTLAERNPALPEDKGNGEKEMAKVTRGPQSEDCQALRSSVTAAKINCRFSCVWRLSLLGISRWTHARRFRFVIPSLLPTWVIWNYLEDSCDNCNKNNNNDDDCDHDCITRNCNVSVSISVRGSSISYDENDMMMIASSHSYKTDNSELE